MSLSTHKVRPQTFSEFTASLTSAADSVARFNLIQDFLANRSAPIIEGEKVYFLYRGKGNTVAVPGEMNNWNPSDAVMERVPRTNIFFRSYSIPVNGRVEYKILVDSMWTLDPFNTRKARGGLGENSDLWMPAYQEPKEVQFNPTIPHGRIDTIWLSSKSLRRKHPVFIYVPPEKKETLPTVFVTDGGDYLSLGKMNNILDNLLAEKRIQPVLGVFVDPRTDLKNPKSNRRMTDYAASDKFLDFLEKEVAPYIERNYPAAGQPNQRVIIGASMGGLISTYAVLKRPQFVSNCAAQSPAFLQANKAVIKLARKLRRANVSIHIDTGTIHDTEVEARLVKQLLEERGARLRYLEIPEGHNWSNWRARIAGILEYFFPAS